MRKVAIACAVIGMVFMAVAALLAFWVTPHLIARLPADANTVRSYDGEIRSMVDPVALRQGDFAAAIRFGLPQTVRRQTQVVQTSGNSALVRDTITVGSSGRAIGSVTSQYAVDRRSLEATSRHPGSWNVTSAKGLTVSFPFGAGQRNYTGWVDLTQTTTVLKYLGQARHAGTETYVYRADVRAGPIKNPQALRGRPASLPVSALEGAGKAGLLPPGSPAALARVVPDAAAVPLRYTYQGTTTYWVAPRTGIVVDIRRSEQQTAGVTTPAGKIIPLLPVLVDSYQGSQASVRAAAHDANSGSNAIRTPGVTVPVAAATVGLALLAVAFVAWLRLRRQPAPERAPTPPSAGVSA